MEEEGYLEGLDVVASSQKIKFNEVEFEIIIGSDIVYWYNSVVPLVKCLNILFKANPYLKFYICYIERAKNVHEHLLSELNSNQYRVKEVG
mmetsp:Transcript_29107/g.21650  ORF Transcript_29107/g.21650 Transcript_29107/m.21650 type:complete len:91 (-) Transcript_29107:74-346(-)|eukprot:CAMPEP_0202959140 /NCGR_PEP_ID=MMETSP1396-20130829/3418_1 /ASSEMBLY_ACC=CAM_ASM_000872 /TAXON_ID= /ORGANISM="Pseudokeronopsis sp., Strain Brazil" /LENGTH=90 /DNA_ID=CAMNT_0049677587 /DNA_START=408 /DNA_END=680 /DNA_ORIENTATION=+